MLRIHLAGYRGEVTAPLEPIDQFPECLHLSIRVRFDSTPLFMARRYPICEHSEHAVTIGVAQCATRVSVRLDCPDPKGAVCCALRNMRKATSMARASRRGSGPSRGTNETGIKRRHAASIVLSVRHAIEILRNFSSEAPLLGITDIASRVGLHKSSVSRLVATLEEDDLVERDPSTRRIRLGRGLLNLRRPFSKASGSWMPPYRNCPSLRSARERRSASASGTDPAR